MYPINVSSSPSLLFLSDFSPRWHNKNVKLRMLSLVIHFIHKMLFFMISVGCCLAPFHFIPISIARHLSFSLFSWFLCVCDICLGWWWWYPKCGRCGAHKVLHLSMLCKSPVRVAPYRLTFRFTSGDNPSSLSPSTTRVSVASFSLCLAVYLAQSVADEKPLPGILFKRHYLQLPALPYLTSPAPLDSPGSLEMPQHFSFAFKLLFFICAFCPRFGWGFPF